MLLIGAFINNILSFVYVIIMKQGSTNSTEHPPQKIIDDNFLQRRLMRFTLGIMRNFQVSQLTYIGILLLQLLQTVSLIIQTSLWQKWPGPIFSYARLVLSYLNIEKLIRQNQKIYVAVLIAACVLLMLMLIVTLVLSCYGSQIYNSSQAQKIAGSLISYTMIVLKTLLQVPLMFIIIYGFTKPHQNGSMVIGLTVLLIVLLVPYFLYVFFLFGSLNPFNTKLICSGQTHFQKIFTLVSKLILVFYIAFDTSHSHQLTMLILALLYNAYLVVSSHWYPYQQFNQTIKYIKQWLRYLLTWFILFIIVCAHTSTQPIIFIYYIIISVMLYNIVYYVNAYTCNRILYENFMKLDNKNRIEMHILRLIYLVDEYHKRECRILLEGYIGYHSRLCNMPNTTCTCKLVRDSTETDIDCRKVLYFQFIANLLKGSMNRVDDTRRIQMILVYIYQYRLNNRFQAVSWLIKLSELNGNIIERLEYMQQMKLIQAEIKQAESKKNIDLTVDMSRFLKFNLRIVQFEKILQKCTNNHIDFWNELLETHLNISKLQKCGSLIANQKQAVKEYFHQMQQLNPNSAHVMVLYGQFLKWVCNDDYQHAKLIEKGQTIFKNLKQSSKFNGKNDKYSDNSKALIIVISGNEKQVGRIVQTNNFVKQIIGYHRKQLISQNISKIMPKIFADQHDYTIRRFLSTSKDTYNGIQRLVTVYTRQGYIIPSLALTKPLPHLQQGIQLVGIISQFQMTHEDQIIDDKIAYILYQTQNQIVTGISKTCFTQYGIPRCLVYGDAQNSVNQFKTKHLFGVNIEKMQDGLRSGRQVVVKMNTKNLRDQFVITNSMSSKNIIQDINQQIFNFSGQVILRSLFQIVYHGTRLRLLSITKDIINDRFQALQHSKLTQSQQKNLMKDQKSDSRSQTDELKDLKDFKNFIAVKRQPMATRFLSWACIVLILIFFAGVGGFIILHTRQIGIIQATMTGIEYAFLNRMFMTELSFQAQKIYINYNDAYPPGQIYPQKYAIAKMKTIIEQAKVKQMYLLPIKQKLNVASLNMINFDFYPNSSHSTNLKSIDQSITIQLGKLYNIANGNGKYFKQYPLNYKSLVVLNYLQTKYTQVFALLQACNTVQVSINQQGTKNNDKFILYIVIEGSILVALALLWLLVSLPRTLQVTQINSKVLSFFNLIAADDVKQVIRKCFIFMKIHLVQSDVDQSKLNVTQNKIDNQPNTFLKRKSQISYFNINQNESHLSPNTSFAGGETSTMIIANTGQATNRKQQLRFNGGGAIDNFEQSSRDKMINKGNKQKKTVILIFGCIFLFLSAYVGTISGYLIVNYNYILAQTHTMNMMYNRTAQFQQIKTMYTKYLTENTLQFNGTWIDEINLDLIQKIYDTQRQLIGQQSDSKYGQLINQLNTGNLCNLIDSYKTYRVWGGSQLDRGQCQSVSNGVLTRGIKTSLVTIMEEIRSMILLPKEDKNKLNMYVVTIEAIKRYTILQKFLVRPLIMISQQIVQTKNQNQSKINLTFYLINALLLVGLLVFWRTFWRKYIMYLNQSVWRTKSMLNLIPTKIITTNDVLMNQFTSGQLEKVVK